MATLINDKSYTTAWQQYLKTLIKSDIWGFAALDWYYNQRKEESHLDPSRFIDELIDALPLNCVNTLEFHRVLLCVSVQLLGADFDEIINKTHKYLKKIELTGTPELINEIAKQYQTFGRNMQFINTTVRKGLITEHPIANIKDDQCKITKSSLQNKRFKIALSFPGEHREFIDKVALSLCETYDEEKILYDRFREAEFARPDLANYLQGLYRDDCELIAVFLCNEYAQKKWCGLELRVIQEVIMNNDYSRIMIFRFDNAEIKGFFYTDGGIFVNKHTPEKIAELIVKRVKIT